MDLVYPWEVSSGSSYTAVLQKSMEKRLLWLGLSIGQLGIRTILRLSNPIIPTFIFKMRKLRPESGHPIQKDMMVLLF